MFYEYYYYKNKIYNSINETNKIMKHYDEIDTIVGRLSSDINYIDNIFNENIIKDLCNKNNINTEIGLTIYNELQNKMKDINTGKEKIIKLLRMIIFLQFNNDKILFYEIYKKFIFAYLSDSIAKELINEDKKKQVIKKNKNKKNKKNKNKKKIVDVEKNKEEDKIGNNEDKKNENVKNEGNKNEIKLNIINEEKKNKKNKEFFLYTNNIKKNKKESKDKLDKVSNKLSSSENKSPIIQENNNININTNNENIINHNENMINNVNIIIKNDDNKNNNENYKNNQDERNKSKNGNNNSKKNNNSQNNYNKIENSKNNNNQNYYNNKQYNQKNDNIENNKNNIIPAIKNIIYDNLLKDYYDEGINNYISITNSNVEILNPIKNKCVEYIKNIIKENLEKKYILQFGEYGSYKTGLSIEGSDIDICIIYKGLIKDSDFFTDLEDILEKFRNKSNKYPYNIKIINAKIKRIVVTLNISEEIKNTPLNNDYNYLDYDDMNTIKIDLTLNESEEYLEKNIKSVNFIKNKLIEYPQIRNSILFFKRYLKVKNMNEFFLKGIGSYELFLMVLSVVKNYQINNPYKQITSGDILFMTFEKFSFFDFRFYGINIYYNYDYKLEINNFKIDLPYIIDPLTGYNVAEYGPCRGIDIRIAFSKGYKQLCLDNIEFKNDWNKGINPFNKKSLKSIVDVFNAEKIIDINDQKILMNKYYKNFIDVEYFYSPNKE